MADPQHTPIPIPEEIWKPVLGYEGLYEVSDLGQGRRLVSRYPWLKPYAIPRLIQVKRFTDRKSPYWYVTLSRESIEKNFAIHRVVARAFLGSPPEGKEVNHKDHDKSNNKLSNFEYLTKKENHRKASEAGRLWMQQGAHSNFAKLSEAQAIAIWEARLIRSNTAAMIAKAHGVCKGTVQKIWHGDHWKHLLKGEPRIYFVKKVKCDD